MTRQPITLVLDNIRSAQNVGSLWRTADAAGIEAIWLCGLTPHPERAQDPRPAYARDRATKLIAKTALGAEQSLPWRYFETAAEAVAELEQTGRHVWALEQADDSVNLFACPVPALPLGLIVGHERGGVNPNLLSRVDQILEIPMFGHKESLNVAVAGGIALYWLVSKL